MNNYRQLLAASLLLLCQISFAQNANITSSDDNTQEVSLSPAQEEQQYIEWAQGILAKLSPQQGDVKLGADIASLKVPENFVF